MTKRPPFRPPDDAARAQARRLIDTATFAALAVLQERRPSVTRIALATTREGLPMSLISSLSQHTAALEKNATCALLVGEPEDRGDPLTHPRLTLQTTARFIARDSVEHDPLRTHYLTQRPKARLYADFTDFRFVLFEVQDALLNGGFGKAFKLKQADLARPR